MGVILSNLLRNSFLYVVRYFANIKVILILEQMILAPNLAKKVQLSLISFC